MYDTVSNLKVEEGGIIGPTKFYRMGARETGIFYFKRIFIIQSIFQ